MWEERKMGRKLVNREKKSYIKDKYATWICVIMYAISILGIRFLNYVSVSANSSTIYFIAIAKTFLVLIILFLNYSMCIGSVPNDELLEEINNFDVQSNNKSDIRKQRDILIHYFDDSQCPNLWKLSIVEIIAGIILFLLFVNDNRWGGIITDLVIDFETIIMAVLFYRTNHYRFKIYKNLKQ